MFESKANTRLGKSEYFLLSGWTNISGRNRSVTVAMLSFVRLSRSIPSGLTMIRLERQFRNNVHHTFQVKKTTELLLVQESFNVEKTTMKIY